MQLETYISDLLYRYECVIVPEFGAFLTQRESAKVHQTTNSFYPPKKVLLFNEQIKQNDGLLGHYIADVEKIPFETAMLKIKKQVQSFQSQLKKGQTLVFENIGDIQLDVNDKLLFEPSYRLNYLTDSFGLSQFVSPVVTREIYKEDVETLEDVIPLTITPEKRRSRPYLRYASIVVIALMLGSFGMSRYSNQVQTHNQLAQEKAQQQLDTKIQQATFIIDNPLPAITLNLNTTTQPKKYHVVAGAFRVKANSLKKVQQLKTLGYNAQSIGTSAYGLYQVAYGSFSNENEALQTLNTVRKTHNTDAWLLIKTLP